MRFTYRYLSNNATYLNQMKEQDTMDDAFVEAANTMALFALNTSKWLPFDVKVELSYQVSCR